VEQAALIRNRDVEQKVEVVRELEILTRTRSLEILNGASNLARLKA
jgi:hypothetical protein